MRRLTRRYGHWRGSSQLRHASFIVAVVLTSFSLVVLPGQWIPVLFHDDLTVIGLSLVILGVGSVASSASIARLGSSGARASILTCTGVGLVMVVVAVSLYKTVFGGIGWPEAHEVGLVLAFVGTCALLGRTVGGLTRRWPRAIRWIPTVLVALLVGGGGVALFSHVLPKSLESRYSASQQACEVRGGIRYCANPGYEPFIDHWQRVVESVLNAAPIDVERSEILIAQLLDDDGRRVEGASAAPGVDWGRGAGEGVASLGLGLDLANWVTGVETRLVTLDPDEPQETCDPGTGSRSVVAFWLAGQVGDDVKAVIGDLGCCADAISGSTFAEPAVGGGWDVARQLLALPAEEVTTQIDMHWDELVGSDTPVARIADMFELGAADVTQEESDDAFPLCGSRFE